MRIAHLLDSIGNTGVSRVLLTLSEAMIANGDDITVLMHRDVENRDLANQFKCDIRRLNLPEKTSRLKFWKSRWDAFASAEADSAVLDDWAARHDIDFVFVHGRPILRFFKSRVPHAAVGHNTKSKMYLSPVWSPRQRLVRTRLHRIYSSQPVITVSEGIRQDLIDRFDIAEQSITTIYNPVDIERIRKLARETSDDIPSRPYFVAAGSAARVKRYDILIKAFAHSEIDADLVILGRGRLTGEYRRLADKLGVGDRLHLPGYRVNPYPFFRQALALVVSSVYEGLPTGIIEALACGIPVVSTDCPSGPREILRGDLSEYLVPMLDIEALANAMHKVVARPYRCADDFFEKFNPVKVADAYHKFARRQLH